MADEHNNKNTILKYFDISELDAFKELDKHLIVTLKTKEDETRSEQLKQDLQKNNPEKKINIIFINEKKDNEDERWTIPEVKKIIAIASGKGGVGKSTTSVNLALALADKGLKIALFDADIYGPSLPTMLGYKDVPPYSSDGVNFEPYTKCGIKSMSIGSMIAENTPLIWRGAKACGAIQQLLTQTSWGEIDLMLVDMPPGTGDIQITLSQKLKLDGAVIVSTPQDIALIDAVKGLTMFNKVNVPVIGIIENMSYYVCEKCGHRADIFGHAGAAQTALYYNVPFLGEIPLHYDIRSNSDRGTPIVITSPESIYTAAYKEIADKICERLKI